MRDMLLRWSEVLNHTGMVAHELSVKACTCLFALLKVELRTRARSCAASVQ